MIYKITHVNRLFWACHFYRIWKSILTTDYTNKTDGTDKGIGIFDPG
jgi:hypothetical protein